MYTCVLCGGEIRALSAALGVESDEAEFDILADGRPYHGSCWDAGRTQLVMFVMEGTR